MIISHHHKFIFIHVHRTGGSNLISLLKSQLRDDLDILSQHGNAMTAEASYLEHYPHYFTFGFVRNPWQRMLSWYFLINKWNRQSREQDRIEFERFLELNKATELSDNYFHYNQLDYFPEDHDEMENFNIYKFENYESEVTRIFEHLGLPLEQMTKTNGTRTINYREFYSERSKQWIEQKCKKDIAYFNYSF